MKIGRISKIAGISFVGFVVATIAADKVNLGPVVSQLAGVLGGLAGTLVGRRRAKRSSSQRVRTESGEDSDDE